MLGTTLQPESVDEWFLCGPIDLVTMTRNLLLERGYVLTCQSHPTSDTVTVDYDAN